MSQFAIQGTVVGAVLRALFGEVAGRALLGASVEVQRFLLILALVIFLWLIPLWDPHSGCASIYLMGVGFGHLVHYVVRTHAYRRARRRRQALTILRMLEQSQQKLPVIAVTGISYFAGHKWRKLRKLLERNEGSLTEELMIIKASMLRVRGEYDEGLRFVETELEQLQKQGKANSHLLVHKALALGEKGDREKEMFDTLGGALRIKPDCVLAKSIMSLRLAEKLLPPEVAAPNEPLKLVREALRLSGERDSSPELLQTVTGSAVPVTWTFLLDVYGYALLKAGCGQLSRSLITQCIIEDPGFSAPYLHLGEWYLIYGDGQSQDQGQKAKSERLAELCLNVAIRLEGNNKQSRIKRRAEALLAE